MSSDSAISVEGIGKAYRLGGTQGLGRYRSLREEITEAVTRRGRSNKSKQQTFWALRDLSFEVKPGETVGVIGRNGAGKSTLLKILSRITPPTTGRAETLGRVGSLLEVGTGFHPELSGRDNVLLSAAIIGMRRAEVASRFDEIVEFSGLERFLDTPVKRYSSGMYMRLAFSVAAHLEPEILLVDEVLAVGDASFQKKCLGRMEDLGQSGRTVLFVSHSMPSVLRLCPRVLLLDGGRLAADGDASHVIEEYVGRGGGGAERVWHDRAAAPGNDRIRMRSVRVLDDRGVPAPEIDIRRPVTIELVYEDLDGGEDIRPYANLHMFNGEGTCLFVTSEYNDPSWSSAARRPGVVTARCTVPGNTLAEGGVFVTAAVSSLEPTVVHAMENDAVVFHVMDPSDGDGVRGPWVGDFPGVMRPMLTWKSDREPLA